MKEFIYTLHLILCGAMGKAPDSPPDGLDWGAVLKYSAEQNVYSLVYCALEAGNPGCPPEIYTRLKQAAFSTMVRNGIRRDSLIAILKGAEAHGLSPLIIKGAVIADSYNQPTARWSCDADVFISEADEKRMEKYLEEECSMMAPRDKHMHHSTFKHQNVGVIELHTQLFSDHAFSVWLSDADIIKNPEKYVYMYSAGSGEIHTLKPLIHYIYICCHALNHFVNSGMNMQMCADIAAFYTKHRSEIDISVLEREMKAVNGERFLKTLFAAIRLAHFDIDIDIFSDIVIDDATVLSLLKDIMDGGINGAKAMDSRHKQSTITTAQKIKNDSGRIGYTIHKFMRIIRKIRPYFFPTKSEIQNKFPGYGLVKGYFPYVSFMLSEHRKNITRIRSESEDTERNRLLKKLGLLK